MGGKTRRPTAFSIAHTYAHTACMREQVNVTTSGRIVNCETDPTNALCGPSAADVAPAPSFEAGTQVLTAATAPSAMAATKLEPAASTSAGPLVVPPSGGPIVGPAPAPAGPAVQPVGGPVVGPGAAPAGPAVQPRGGPAPGAAPGSGSNDVVEPLNPNNCLSADDKEAFVKCVQEYNGDLFRNLHRALEQP